MNKKAESKKGCFWCCIPSKRASKHAKQKAERKMAHQEGVLHKEISSDNSSSGIKATEAKMPETNQPINAIEPEEKEMAVAEKQDTVREISQVVLAQGSPKPIDIQSHEVRGESVELAKEMSILIEIQSNVNNSLEENALEAKPEPSKCLAKVQGAVTDRILSNKLEHSLPLNKSLCNSSQYSARLAKGKDSVVKASPERSKQDGKENQEPAEVFKESLSDTKEADAKTPRHQISESAPNLLIENDTNEESSRLDLDMQSPSHIQSSDEDGSIRPINAVRWHSR